MLLSYVGLFIGFCVLIFSADYFVKGASALAKNIGVSPLIIGLTIVGLGTSAPEMLVAGFASLEGNTGLAIGNAVGSNIANIGLVLGVSTLVSPIFIKSSLLRREFPILLLASVVSYLLLLDGTLSFIDGSILIVGLIAFLIWLIHSARKSREQGVDPLETDCDADIPSNMKTSSAWLLCLLGLVGLVLSSKLLVWAAVNIATHFGISDLVIGLTIVAIGTSLPELAASITSILKKEPDLALGNVIGSNLFNLLAVLCLPGIIHPGAVDELVLTRDMPMMLGITVFLFAISFGFKKEACIGRIKGLVLTLVFIGYMSKLYFDSLTTIIY
ncbi:MAG: calcium/sodium antiporter [Piscirickettsiaceae bacterium]|nr:MAG: calcium/sodium antiporter [Piscirickettsiaceae bacterium]